MEVNFEIGTTLYERIKKYAKFFSMTANHFMQMLLTMGIDDYLNDGGVKGNVKIMDAMLDKRELLKEKQRELYKIKKTSNGIKVDVLEDEIRHIKQDIRRYVKRCKINLSSESLDKLDEIVKEENQKNKEICRSDIICSFIEFELNNRVEYLTWKKDILNDDELNMPYKVVLNIPKLFWEYLDEQAKRLNIGVEDYIKILIENKYDQDNHI